MKKLSESRVVTQNVDDVLARYNDEAESIQSDSVQLGPKQANNERANGLFATRKLKA